MLVVDDCVDTAEMMAEALAQFGYEPSVAQDADTALRLARELTPHAAMIDIELLQGMDGIELSRQLRTEHGAQVTLIVISGYGPGRYGDEAIAAGVQHYLLKPVDLDKQETLLREVFSGPAAKELGATGPS